MTRREGTVLYWAEYPAGYGGHGFIGHDQSGPDIFVHYSDLEDPRTPETVNGLGHRTLRVGEVVGFDVVEAPKGPKAVHVQRVRE